VAQSVEIQVLAVTPGFAPTFVVLDPGDSVVLTASNPGSQSTVQGTPSLLIPGTYTIQVSGINGAAGQFLISVQAGEMLLQPLVLGENLLGAISVASDTVRYGLTVAAPQSVNLQVLAITPGFAPAFRVIGADDGVLIDVANANGQNNARSPVDLPGAFTYIVEVRSANNTTGQYLISVQPNAPLPTATPNVTVSPTPISTAAPSPTAPAQPNGNCSVTPNSSQAVNVRFGPGTNYGIVGSLAEGANAPVVGRLEDNSWYQIDRGSGSVGWVSLTVVTLSGDCSSVPLVSPPPPPLPTMPPNPTLPSDVGGQLLTPQATTSSRDPLGDINDVTEFLTAEPTQSGTTGGILDNLANTNGIDFAEFEPVDTRPDLLIYGVNLQKTPQDADNPYMLNFVITNRGGSTAPGPISVRLCIIASCFNSTYGGIGAGGGSGIGFPLGRQFIGMTATYTLFVDYADTISETDESNNFVSGTLNFN
jgi:hypothetical protein